jgi:hypothetical protein
VPATQPRTTQSNPAPSPAGRSAGGDIGSGSGDIGKGAGDLVTLHPVGATENVGKGAGDAGKDVGVGAVKGAGKIAKDTGKLVARPFHHSKKNESSGAPSPSDETPH